MIAAIDTRYKGYRFRSRLEARWAVFFDTLGVSYEYEPQGFELSNGQRYLPDFWLSTVRMWAEVKPVPFSQEELDKAALLTATTGYETVLLVGTPDAVAYEFFSPCRGARTLLVETPGDPLTWDQYTCDPGVHDERCCGGRRYEFNPGGVLLSEEYLFDEHRFFYCPGDDPEPGTRQALAIEAARSARFEFGETPR